jgi:hypothetical protein
MTSTYSPFSILLFALAPMTGCFNFGGHSAPPDAGSITDAGNPSPDAATFSCTATPLNRCVDPSLRSKKTAEVRGTITDFATGQPIAGVTVAINTAWGSSDWLAELCPPIATLVTGNDGTFGPVVLGIGSDGFDILNFMVTGAGRAPTHSDVRVRNCSNGASCDPVHQEIAVPTVALMDSWRSELAAGGMPGASCVGLTLMQFFEQNGMPAAGVSAKTGLFSTTASPGLDVRYVAANRLDLSPATQTITTSSGLALLSTQAARSELVGGTRLSSKWINTGVLGAPGWLFVEGNTLP